MKYSLAGTLLVAKLHHISSGCSSIDELLDGGFPVDCVSLVYGEATTGKTTLAIQTSIECARDGFKVIYVDADRSFSHQRLYQMAPSEASELGRRIVIFLPETFSEQSSVIEDLENYLSKVTKLIIVDTVTSLYRASLGSAERTFTLNRELNRQIAYLAEIALKHRLCVMVTSQVHSSMDVQGWRIEPVARRILFHWPKVKLFLKPTGKAGVKEAILEHPRSSTGEIPQCYYTLTEKGLDDIKP
jgi:DNA repair protein RadB